MKQRKGIKVKMAANNFTQAMEIAFYRLKDSLSTVIDTEFGSILIEKKVTKNTDALPDVVWFKNFKGPKYSKVYIQYCEDDLTFYAQVPFRLCNDDLVKMDLEFVMLKAMIMKVSKNYITFDRDEITAISLAVYYNLHSYGMAKAFKERFYARYITTIFNEDKNKLMFEMYYSQITRSISEYNNNLKKDCSLINNIDRIIGFPIEFYNSDQCIYVYHEVLIYVIANIIAYYMNPFTDKDVFSESMDYLRTITAAGYDSDTDIIITKTPYQYMKYVIKRLNRMIIEEKMKND